MSNTNIKKAWEEGRVVRKTWSREENGRQLLCLLAALAGDPGVRPETCSADVCPTWLAHLLPWMADYGTAERFASIVERLIALEPHLATLPPETEWRVRALCVREAMRHTQDAAARAVAVLIATLCERRGRGASNEEFAETACAAREAYVAAKAAADASGDAAAWAADAARADAAAWAAADDSADAAADAEQADASADAAVWAARAELANAAARAARAAADDAAKATAAGAAWAAVDAAWATADAAAMGAPSADAADRLTAAILSELEKTAYD